MSANNDPAAARDGDYIFAMPQRIPSYLLAIAAGDLVFRPITDRAGVWAEPAMADKAAAEFADTGRMMDTTEQLYGPYRWDRYDILVLPPSFPYGGMENPRLTFLTPTLLAGDRSLVDVVAHELAHSWTGNLVTNATAEHFWLNEGATVWAERRIREALHGADEAILGWAMGQNSLEESLQRFGPTSPFTRLRTQLEGVDPDEVFSTVPYEKGSRFLALIETTVGRETFDRFMRDYMARYRFTSITTEEFIAFLEEKLPGTAAKVDAQSWLYEPGMPANAPVFRSPMLDDLVQLANGWAQGMRPTPEQIASWNPSQMVVYLQNLPRQLDAAACDWLDTALGLTRRGNYEILVEWLTIAGASDYPAVFDRTREVLTRVGRMKYLRPLYTALGKHPRTRALAHDIFAVASPTYHGLSRRVVQGIMDKYPA
jgi:aminopeptidase N